MAQFSFDTSSVEKRESNFDLLPAGWYVAQVVESEVLPLKSGLGKALKLTFSVLTEGFVNRKVWARLNVQHTNPKTEKISQEQLRELCDSIGVVRFNDTSELHNKPVQIRVKIRKDDTGQYEDQNEIAGFKAAGGAVAPASMMPPRAAAPGAAPATAAAGSVPPWAKRAA